MAQAVIQGLDCFVSHHHDIGCAADQLVRHLDRARIECKTNGAAWGLNESDTRLAWLFAKSNRDSLQLHGDATATL
jgi:hypothetical protein